MVMDADQIMSQAEQQEIDEYHSWLDKMEERDRQHREIQFQMLSEVKPLISWEILDEERTQRR